MTDLDLAILGIADSAIFPAADRLPEALVPAGARVDRIGFAAGPNIAMGGAGGATVRLIVPMTLDEALAFHREALLALSGDGQVGQEGNADSGFFVEILLPNGERLSVGINPAGPDSASVEFAVVEDLFPLSETERAFIAGLGVPDDFVPPDSPGVTSVALLRLFSFEPATHFNGGFLLDPTQADATFEYYKTLFENGGGSLTLDESNPTRRVVCYGFAGAFIVRITLDEPGLISRIQIQLFPNDEGSIDFRTNPCEAGLR